MNALILMPNYVQEKIDGIVADFRASHPDATDEDGAHIRQQLVNAFADYGHIPEFEIVKTPPEAA